MKRVRSVMEEYLAYKIDNNPEVAIEVDVDNTKIGLNI